MNMKKQQIHMCMIFISIQKIKFNIDINDDEPFVKENFHFFTSSLKKFNNNYLIFKLNYLAFFFFPLFQITTTTKSVSARQMISLDFE
jgi:hypothetical protein